MEIEIWGLRLGLGFGVFDRKRKHQTGQGQGSCSWSSVAGIPAGAREQGAGFGPSARPAAIVFLSHRGLWSGSWSGFVLVGLWFSRKTITATRVWIKEAGRKSEPPKAQRALGVVPPSHHALVFVQCGV